MTGHIPNSQPEWESLIKYALDVWTANTDDADMLASLSTVRERLKSGNLRTAVSQWLEEALFRLEELSPPSARLLRLRFRDKEPVRIVANRLNLAESSIYRLQREALQALAQIVMEMESSAREATTLHCPTCTHLNGLLLYRSPVWFGDLSPEGDTRVPQTSTRLSRAEQMAGLFAYY